MTDGSANPLSGIEAILYYREAGGEWARYQLDNEERMFTDGARLLPLRRPAGGTYQLRLENADDPARGRPRSSTAPSSSARAPTSSDAG